MLINENILLLTLYPTWSENLTTAVLVNELISSSGPSLVPRPRGPRVCSSLQPVTILSRMLSTYDAKQHQCTDSFSYYLTQS